MDVESGALSLYPSSVITMAAVKQYLLASSRSPIAFPPTPGQKLYNVLSSQAGVWTSSLTAALALAPSATRAAAFLRTLQIIGLPAPPPWVSAQHLRLHPLPPLSFPQQ